MAWWR